MIRNVAAAALIAVALTQPAAAECLSEQEARRQLTSLAAFSLTMDGLEPRKQIAISKVIGAAAMRVLEGNYAGACRAVDEASREIARIMCGRVVNGACRG
jgi:hypothetical protein